MLTLRPISERGSTLIEATIAAAICAIFLGSLFTMNTSTMETIRMAKEAACASQVLQQRVEGLRIANWHQITDADWVRTNLLNTDAPGSANLKGLAETLVFTPYGSSSTTITQVERSGGAARVVTSNAGMLLEKAMKVCWTITFTGAPNDRSQSRQTVAILAKGGVAK
jgi:type II secretory pathway pseudopilin PulG